MTDTANLCERLRDRAAFCKDCGGVTTYDEGDSALDNEAADLIERLDAMLAASPVVPVGVSRADARLMAQSGVVEWLAGYKQEYRAPHDTLCDLIADAILAALRPTDTGRE